MVPALNKNCAPLDMLNFFPQELCIPPEIHCNTLQHTFTTIHCNTLQHTCTTIHCNTLATHYNTLTTSCRPANCSVRMYLLINEIL